MAAAALLALLATAIGFALGLLLLRVLGEKAWHHGIALSVGVFFVIFFALLSSNLNFGICGTLAVTALTLLFWYAGFWPALGITFAALISYTSLLSFSALPKHNAPPR